MQMVKIGVKAVVSVVGGVFLGGGNILLGMGMAAICYVLLSYYAWYMKRRGVDFLFSLVMAGLWQHWPLSCLWYFLRSSRLLCWDC